MNIIDKFLGLVTTQEDNSMVSPTLTYGTFSFIYIKHKDLYRILTTVYLTHRMILAQGSDSGPFGMGCVNTISKEMGPFSALSEWNEWINFHSKWVSYQHGHSIWVHSALISHSIWVIFSPLIFNMGHLQHKYSLTTMRWEFFSFRRYF